LEKHLALSPGFEIPWEYFGIWKLHFPAGETSGFNNVQNETSNSICPFQ